MIEEKILYEVLSKVFEVILLFWIIKIVVIILGEIVGDVLFMLFNLGYIVSMGIFVVIFVIFVVV